MAAIVTKEIAEKIFENVMELATAKTVTKEMRASATEVWIWQWQQDTQLEWELMEEVGQIIQDAAQLLTDREFERFERRLFQIIEPMMQAK